MAEVFADNHLSSFDFPVVEYAGRGLAEAPATFDLRPSSPAEADMVREIEAIQARLRQGIPRLHREVDDLLARINISGSL